MYVFMYKTNLLTMIKKSLLYSNKIPTPKLHSTSDCKELLIKYLHIYKKHEKYPLRIPLNYIKFLF